MSKFSKPCLTKLLRTLTFVNKVSFLLFRCRGPEGVFRQVRRHRGGDGDEGPDHEEEQGIRVRHLLRPQQRRQGPRPRATRPRRQKGEVLLPFKLQSLFVRVTEVTPFGI